MTSYASTGTDKVNEWENSIALKFHDLIKNPLNVTAQFQSVSQRLYGVPCHSVLVLDNNKDHCFARRPWPEAKLPEHNSATFHLHYTTGSRLVISTRGRMVAKKISACRELIINIIAQDIVATRREQSLRGNFYLVVLSLQNYDKYLRAWKAKKLPTIKIII